MNTPNFIHLIHFDGKPIIIRVDYILRVYTDIHGGNEYTKIEFTNGVTELVKDSVDDIIKYIM